MSTASSPEGAARRGGSDPLPPHELLTRYYASEQERRNQINRWFDASASRYDAIQQAMSFGTGHWYRKEALLRAGVAEGMRLLDVASGTGVLAAHGQEIVGPRGLSVGVDRSAGMLREAHRRGVQCIVQAVAEDLPFASGTFDRLTMGFALRHVADLSATFREYRRLLKPGGKVLILEITPPRSRLAFHMLKIYLRRVVPLVTRLAGCGPGAQELMEYHWDTIENCVPPTVILAALEDAGFSTVERNVALGIFSEYIAVR
jgi:demethylmenaquinone methyltransferase/2-methoxy-6-polyprenyl-1,4-benzoquinol methylase